MVCGVSHALWRRCALLTVGRFIGSTFDYVTVGETAVNPPEEDNIGEVINQKDALSKEATLINQALSVQVLDRNATPMKFEAPDPFASDVGGEDVAPKGSLWRVDYAWLCHDRDERTAGYVYRKWDLEDGHVLVARCDLDGFTKGVRGADEMVCACARARVCVCVCVCVCVLCGADGRAQLAINALNEYDPKAGMDWRRTIDSQGGAVLAAELKANANKLAQWSVR